MTRQCSTPEGGGEAASPSPDPGKPAGPSIALVLGRVGVDAAAQAKLADIVEWLFAHGARHMSLVGVGAADPAAWSSKSAAAFAPAGVCSIGAAAQARHFARTDQTLCLLPEHAGRAAIVAALGALQRLGAPVTHESLDAEVARLCGPSPDLVLLIGENARLEDAFCWNAAYTELYLLPAPWEALSEADIARAIADFTRRDRRFGALGPAAP